MGFPNKSILDKIDNLPTEEEVNNYYVNESGIFPSYSIGNWDKAFKDKESAQKWLDDIKTRVDSVTEIIDARKKTYKTKVDAFEYIPTKIGRDAVLKAKNNVAEAYNRYKPINKDIESILNKGVTIESSYPGLTNADVDEKIKSYNGSGVKDVFCCAIEKMRSIFSATKNVGVVRRGSGAQRNDLAERNPFSFYALLCDVPSPNQRKLPA